MIVFFILSNLLSVNKRKFGIDPEGKVFLVDPFCQYLLCILKICLEYENVLSKFFTC